jgi:hypothetical protein
VPDSKFVQIRQVWHWFLEQQVSFTLAAVVSVFQYFRIEFGVYKDVGDSVVPTMQDSLTLSNECLRLITMLDLCSSFYDQFKVTFN